MLFSWESFVFFSCQSHSTSSLNSKQTYSGFILLCKQDGKIHILDGAEKEVRKMLSENLVNKFRATNQYKDINALIFSAT